MPYEMRGQDVIDFAASVRTEVKTKGDELWFKKCPYCQGGGKDIYTFSVNLESGAYKCFRASCGKQGHFVELARDFGFRLDFGEQTKKEYRRLPQKEVTVRKTAVEFLKSRGISPEITERYRITTRKDNDKVLVFPFYDESGIMQFIKYRKTDFKKGRDKNKEWCETDTKPILFGMAQCKDFGRLVITEGQIDSLSLAEAGIENAVSVPTGAKGFTWVTNCWEWLKQFERIVVFGDYENGRITLVEELSRRFPKLEVVQPEFYLGEKDANDILRKYGKQAIIDAVESAQMQPVKRIKRLADVQKVDLTSLPRITTGIREIDRAIGGLYFGQVVLLTGRRGEGKSTFMSQIIADALRQECRVLAYSGELADYHFKSWLDFQLAGSNYVATRENEFGDKWYLVPDETAKRIEQWYYDNVFIYDNNSVDSEDEFESLLETVEQAVQRYGINLVCIDNLMTALDIDLKDDLYRSQSKFVHRLKKLASKYGVAVLLVAHPRKRQGDIENDDVSGSADITNRVDVVMSYSRARDEEAHDSEVTVTKNRLTGVLITKRDPVRLSYSKKSKRIMSINYGEPDKTYGWETFENGFARIETPEDLPF